VGGARTFIKTSIIGGLAVILPAVVLILIFRWLFNWVADIIQPLTSILVAKGQLQEIVADVLAIAIILAICFVVGVVVRTRAGQFLQDNLENRILRLAPGYPTIRSVVMQFIGQKKSPFSSVALVRVFGNETLMTAFVTDTHRRQAYRFCTHRSQSDFRPHFSYSGKIRASGRGVRGRDHAIRDRLWRRFNPSSQRARPPGNRTLIIF
jgi:uncharacterized membrane protein